jgi:hypothetical protein
MRRLRDLWATDENMRDWTHEEDERFMGNGYGHERLDT